MNGGAVLLEAALSGLARFMLERPAFFTLMALLLAAITATTLWCFEHKWARAACAVLVGSACFILLCTGPT
ncbi:MAG TPA: hypothetical protein VG943_13905 [Caulobacterales bacterium]|nr:hypothetical protein [Caulobacterales bacterium]